MSAWTAGEVARLGEMVAVGDSYETIAAVLGRSVNAVTLKRRRGFPPPPAKGPRWMGSPLGNRRWWTAERVLEGLRDFAAKHAALPTSDHEYSALKRGHMEWPTAARVLELHGTMADAWAAIGKKVSRQWVPWTVEEDDYLLETAGAFTLRIIARRLRRSAAACRRRLYDLGAGRARDVSGDLSAMQVAKLYDCPLARVKRFIATGKLPARKVVGGHYWRIDPGDCERIKGELSAPKRHSYRTSAVSDHGDYERRYGLRRVVVGGKTVRVTANVARRDADGIHVLATRFRPYVRRFGEVGA